MGPCLSHQPTHLDSAASDVGLGFLWQSTFNAQCNYFTLVYIWHNVLSGKAKTLHASFMEIIRWFTLNANGWIWSEVPTHLLWHIYVLSFHFQKSCVNGIHFFKATRRISPMSDISSQDWSRIQCSDISLVPFILLFPFIPGISFCSVPNTVAHYSVSLPFISSLPTGWLLEQYKTAVQVRSQHSSGHMRNTRSRLVFVSSDIVFNTDKTSMNLNNNKKVCIVVNFLNLKK